MKYYLAIDIGASSGRGIVGWLENDELKTDEVYRFHNGIVEEDGHLIWDIGMLFREVKNAVREAFGKYDIGSLSIDTWGVDYVLMDGDKEILPVYSYRDSRTEEAIGKVHELISFEELYRHTGCQFQPFNSVYQLYCDKLEGRLDKATDFLMIPEYLLYKLTGVRTKEFTDATTTGLINHETLEFDKEITDRLSLPAGLFGRLDQPGKKIGRLKKEIAEETGGNCDVVLCATHDTASAVEGIDMQGREPYISSGTWSLLGVKTDAPITDPSGIEANYSNEGGVGYNRYQKNIMGMWLVNELQKELCPDMSINEIVGLAAESNFVETINANDNSLLAPKSMKEAFDALLKNKPADKGGYFRCAYQSLAECYKEAIVQLENNTGRKYEELYIVGGGAKNKLLNEMTAEATGKKVIALPIEATAIGNLLVQMKEY